ncbi:MAG TPA: isochorismatase family cysteine hydrolase [Herpetosiphonaceae bacterium]|nr:isochorismatase family cysteine hydrolase [Herpetosiphonaceae bacterium]
MPTQNHDLHGSAPDESPVVMLIIDLINDFMFDGGAELYERSLPVARNIAALRRRAKEAGIPIVYVNDNFGKWQSDLRSIIAHCLEDDVRGRPIVRLLQPEDDDYAILKPKHSGFYATTLELLLKHLGARTLIVCGISTHICVQFTANDAYMRDFALVIPADCVAADSDEDGGYALRSMRDTLDARIDPSPSLDLDRLKEAH